MGRKVGQGFAGVLALLAVMPLAHAGMPRGAIVSADEQDADPETGITIARGNAEIAIEKMRILGRASEIEINPAAKRIVFKGQAQITVGAERYQGGVVTCALDFNTCSAGEAAPSAANAATTPQPSQQPLPSPAGLGGDAGVTSPR